MVELNLDLDVDIDSRDFKEGIAESYARHIEESGMECEKEDCKSNYLKAEVWVSDSGSIEGAAVCQECNSRINLNIEDSSVQDAIEEIEDALSGSR